MFHFDTSAPPLPPPHPPLLPSFPSLPSSTPPLPPLPSWEAESLSASDIADGLYALHSSPPPSTASAATAALERLHRLAAALFSLIDPLHSDPAPQPPPSSTSTPTHLHSSLTYHDPHQCDEQSIIELLPLLAQLADALSTPSLISVPPHPSSPSPIPSSADPPLPPSPPLRCSSSSVLFTFLTLHWPFCCLFTISRVSLSLPFSPSQLRLLQSKLQLSVRQQLSAQAQQSQAAATITVGSAVRRRALPSLTLSTPATYDWLPLVQTTFHLTIRFAHIDPAPSPPTPLDDDAAPLSTPFAAVSWLSLLHCLLVAHRTDLLSNAHYLLDTRMQHSPPFCSYLHRQLLHLLTTSPSPSLILDHHHLSLLLLLSSDEDYQTKAFDLVTLAMSHSFLAAPAADTSTPSQAPPNYPSLDDPSISFFTPRFDASHPAVRLWSSLLSLPYLEQKASLILRFALHLIEAPSNPPPLLSLAFHITLLLFTSIPATRPSVVESIRSALFFDPLPPLHRRLFASLLAFLVLSSPPSHLSPLREPIKLCLSCLTLAPLPLALSTLLALLPCFLPSSALSLDDLFPFLNKWSRALRVDHPLLTLTSALWLLGRWGGWEEEEKGLLRLIEEGWRRLSEEGRGWLLTQLTAIIDHPSHPFPLPVHLPLLPLSLSASTESLPLASLLLAVNFGLSPAALSSLLALLHRAVAHYVHERQAGPKRSKWSVPVARLHLPACFRLEWNPSRAGEEDEDEVYARMRREEKQRKRRKRGGVHPQRVSSLPQAEVVALRDPIPLLLHCAWSALTADAAALASSSPTSPLLLALVSALARQCLDTSSFLSLLCAQPHPDADDVKEAEEPVLSLSAFTAVSVHCVSESLISSHQRWSLLQSLCLALGRITWDDSRQWRSEVQRQRKAMEAATPQPLSSLQALKSSKPTVTERLPLSSFKFVAKPPTSAESSEKDPNSPHSSFALLTSLPSALPPSLSSSPDCHLLLLEQAAFLGLLMDFSPAVASPVSNTLAASLLLPSSFLIAFLHDYVDSLSRPPVIPSHEEWPQRKASSISPSLSLISVTFAVKSLLQVALPASSSFPSVPAASLLPSFTPCSTATASMEAQSAAASAAFSCIFSVFCASLGLRESALRVEAVESPAPFPCSPPSSISKAVFSSARLLSFLFEAAASTPLVSSASPAWSKATAVYEQPEQYAEEVWNLRTHALLALTQLIQRFPTALPNSLPASATLSASTVLALLLVHLFLYELDHQLTVPLAHAYIDCIHALHALAPSASPSPSLRLTLALLPSLKPSSSLLCTDYRLARKIYHHVFTSMSRGTEERRRAVQLMKEMLDEMWKNERGRKKETTERVGVRGVADGRWTKRLRSGRERRERRASEEEGEARSEGGAGSDDSDFDDARERRHQRFLTRFSRSAVLELDRQKEEDRRDRQEVKEKRVRKELLLSIVRYAAAELKSMRKAEWKDQPTDNSSSSSPPPTVHPLLCSRVHDEAVFVSHVLCALDFLCSSSRLESLLDCSFAASLPASDSPSVRLHSPLVSLLHDCLLHTAHLLQRTTALVTSNAAERAEPRAGASTLADLFSSNPPAGLSEVARGPSLSALTPPPHLTSSSPSPLTFLHLTRQLAAAIAPTSTLLSFLTSSPHLPAAKAVDAKLSISRARNAALNLVDALRTDLRCSAQQLPTETNQISHATAPTRKRRRARVSRVTAAEDTTESQREEKEEEGRAAPRPQVEVEAERRLAVWLKWLGALRAELDVEGSRRGLDGRGGGEAGGSKAQRAQLGRRRRGAAVLHSRNRYVDALLQEERETKDSFMDLEDFLV